MRSNRTAAVLVVVLLASAAVWTLLTAFLLAIRLQLEVGVAARDQRLARVAAHTVIERLRDRDWWSGEPLTAAEREGDTPACVWRVNELGLDAHSAWYQVDITLGRSRVSVDATAHRAPP